MDMQKNW